MNRTQPLLSSVLLAVALLSGCSQGADAPPPGTPRLQTSTEAGNLPVDAITWALPQGEPTTLDPVRVGGQSENTVTANLCEALMRLQPDFSVKPGLAESAEWTGDKTFTIRVRSGVTFWDGAPLTAEDVAFSLRRAADPKTGSVYTTGMQRVTSVEVTGPLEVTVRFRAPDAQFRNGLASMLGVVVQKKYAEANTKTFGSPGGGLMCTGPYRLTSWTSGKAITVEANQRYRDGIAKVARIDFTFLSNAATLASALNAGEIDGAFGVPFAAVSTLSRSSHGRVLFGPSTASVSFGPTTDRGPAADPRVRTALDLAIDKNAFIAGVLRGYGEPLKTFTPPFAWGGLPDAAVYRAGYDALPAVRQDLDEAKRLVAEAGATGATLTVVTGAGDTTGLQTATVVQDAGRRLGLTIDIQQLQPTEFSAMFYDPAARSRFDLVATTGYVDVPGALYYAPDFVFQDGIFNWSGYADPQATTLLRTALENPDPASSARDFVAAQTIFAPARLQVSLATVYERTYLSNRLTGIPTSNAYLNSPWALHLGGVE